MKITNIKQQVKRQDRYSIFVDGKFVFSLSESALIESGLYASQELTAAELSKLKKTAGLDKIYNNALRYVAMRPRSQGELNDYFKRKSVDEATAKQIIKRLERIGLVDDLAFARSWVANRRQLKNVSQRRLKLELKQKHLDQDIISDVLSEDETDEREVLRALIEKKRRRYPDDQKLIQYLSRQGFNYDDIKSVMSDFGA